MPRQHTKQNIKAARKKVEIALEKYKMYLLTLPDDMLPKITSSYSIAPPSKTNQFYSSTEAVAIQRIDYEREREEYMQRIQAAVNRCSEMERAIIIQCYMQPEDVYDYEIYNELGLSERKFYHLKGKALDKLAVILGFISVEELFND
ncbi:MULTISPECIES: ArpU family phage packaging/lysis transcriptional regulator [Anoxybacillaceae]|jgi:ArpU family phage transcriptional regulator|uniref:Phage transcriptional regulator, ArpU family n=1 Tax=Parageobacillus thermantarcticus TaxID=186116 RepID=A0A1I0TS19_9BACL|nr:MULTISPECIES: ArpU family phage packaging/lysis transcriptional regulator [Bacillaceae]MED3905814.1 ArpU family phage packaging/lysis transcriptional regulator [Geobacillus thermodenitrificans]SFA54601.1 phage transcriptional regulator, ArpU family [Parageobacillus thermantarcticus]